MFGAACLFHSRKSQEYENRFEWNLVESSAMNHRAQSKHFSHALNDNNNEISLYEIKLKVL